MLSASFVEFLNVSLSLTQQWEGLN